ncbi:hypothetical protein HD806DRAFT_550713 [Xylariaceae sp. AK1471]|nr:hypothetical protein HD806DRAFT_550713 [Xylariaceae sp. AK1471]
MGKKVGQWYDSSLTTMQRAEIILSGITQRLKHCWVAENLDKFVFNMNKILWPDVTYQRRRIIFAADAKWKYAHRRNNNDDGDCCFCREDAYRTCAIQLLASVLEDCETRHATTRDSLPQSKRITRSELPNWIRRPSMLEAHLHPNVVDTIKALNSSSDEPVWNLKITTNQRVDILLAHLVRRWSRRVANSVERRREAGALFYFFESNFALDLRSEVRKEVKLRREAHSSDWNQINGVWMVVRLALRTVLEECEKCDDEEPVPKSTIDRLRDWFNKRLKLGESSSARNLPWANMHNNFSHRTSWGKYSV